MSVERTGNNRDRQTASHPSPLRQSSSRRQSEMPVLEVACALLAALAVLLLLLVCAVRDLVRESRLNRQMPHGAATPMSIPLQRALAAQPDLETICPTTSDPHRLRAKAKPKTTSSTEENKSAESAASSESGHNTAKSSRQPTAESQHLCPLCDTVMHRRSAGRGGKFWVCLTYPVCKGTCSVADPTKRSPVVEVRRRREAQA